MRPWKILSHQRQYGRLSKTGRYVFIITSCDTDVTFCPASVNLIRIDPVAEWPEHGHYQNRFFKRGIPFLFPNIETNIYLDSNIMITDETSRLIHFFKLIMRKHFIVTNHRDRRDWKDEYEAIIRQRRCFDRKKSQEQAGFFVLPLYSVLPSI